MKPGWSASRRVNLLDVSMSLLRWQAVAGRIGVQSSHALRSNARRTWRHREGARNGHHTASRDTPGAAHARRNDPIALHSW